MRIKIVYTLIFFGLLNNFIACVGTERSKQEVSRLIIASSLNEFLQEKGTPQVTLGAPSENTDFTTSVIDPDPDRKDPRYLLSDEEIKYIADYEDEFKQAGYFSEENLQTLDKELQELIDLKTPTQDDLDMFVDEIELGLPHRKRTLTIEEKKQKEIEVHSKIEGFYARVGNEIPNVSNEDLETILLNISANIRLNQILEEQITKEGLAGSSFQKNLDLVIYLRRRVIAEMIERGIR